MAISNQEFYLKTLKEKDFEINKILEKSLSNNDEIIYKTIGVSFPPEILCWLPIIGSLFIKFGMKDYLIAVTKEKVILSNIDIESLSEKSTFYLSKNEIQNTEFDDETFSLNSHNGKTFTFKEMPINWGNSLKIAIN